MAGSAHHSTASRLPPPSLFLPFPSSSPQAAAAPLAHELSTRTLLYGPAQCGKTSLLLQFAYARAKRGLTTLFVCQSRG